MKTPNVLKNQKGFSLVELMVVVAIIGILAVIGIPQYQKFMAKARQAEAKTHLNAIFQGEASFFTEYNFYTIGMKSIGAAATGNNLRYNAGTSNLAACTAYPGAPLPPEFVTAAGDADDFRDANVNSGTAPGTWDANLAPLNATGVQASTCGAAAYLLHAWGNPTNADGVAPSNANDNQDVFSINQNRVLSHVRVGL